MTGAGLAAGLAGTGAIGTAAADTPPDPQNLRIESSNPYRPADRTDTSIAVNWDEPSGTDVDHYEIDVYDYTCGAYGCYSGEHLKTVVADHPTWHRVQDLRPGNTYYFYVTAVDADGDESGPRGIKAGTYSEYELVGDESNWDAGDNELGGWTNVYGFANGDGTVTDEGLALDYDDYNHGVFRTYFEDPDQSSGAWQIPNYENKSIKFVTYGQKGDEAEDVKLTFGQDANDEQESGNLGYYTVWTSVDQTQSILSVPLRYANQGGVHWDVSTPETFILEFGQESDRDSTLTIEDMWVSDYQY